LRGSVYSELEDVPPDHERRPLTVRQVADSLGLPYETVRRRFVEMLDRGVAKRVGREGFIVPQEVFAKPEFMHSLRRSHQSLMRFLKELKSVGVDAS
jgi:DNA-binding transcriptional regulator YhcF (GntR family)